MCALWLMSTLRIAAALFLRGRRRERGRGGKKKVGVQSFRRKRVPDDETCNHVQPQPNQTRKFGIFFPSSSFPINSSSLPHRELLVASSVPKHAKVEIARYTRTKTNFSLRPNLLSKNHQRDDGAASFATTTITTRQDKW